MILTTFKVTMKKCFEKFVQELRKLSDGDREESFYPALKSFLEEFASSLPATKNFAVEAIQNPSKRRLFEAGIDGDVGFPDFQVEKKGEITIGQIEVKKPNKHLDDKEFQEQFNRYKTELDNIIFTNFKKWELWQNIDGKMRNIANADFDFYEKSFDTDALQDLLEKFFLEEIRYAKNTKELSVLLARKTKTLRKTVQVSLKNDNAPSELIETFQTVKTNLVRKISIEDFADVYAQTIAYALFFAKIESEKENKGKITRFNALEFLPTESVPLLSKLYSIIAINQKKESEIEIVTQILVEQLNQANFEMINAQLEKEKGDPVIYFYEPFLNEYDKETKKDRGVFYTPKEITDFIIRGTDEILRKHFDCEELGIADSKVKLLDPATGSATFLVSAIEKAHDNVFKKFGKNQESLAKESFLKNLENHILENFFGFELMMAPYAVAHLKLHLLLKRLGIKNEAKKHFQVLLANTLEKPSMPQQQIDAFEDEITKESRRAKEVKSKEEIIAIIGNPPYKGESENKGEGFEWIADQLKVYKDFSKTDGENIHREQNPKLLNDDYVKFFRFSQWKIAKEKQGMVAMITNHGYLDNSTFRAMRKSLMDDFDEIYILDLHGNLLKKEKTPDGGKDESVFTIRLGAAICFLIKKRNKNTQQKKVFHADMYGLRKEKLEKLKKLDFEKIEWKEIFPKPPEFFLLPKKEKTKEWKGAITLLDIFPLNLNGIKTSRDSFVIDFETETLSEKIQIFYDETLSSSEIARKFNIKTEFITKVKKKNNKFSQKKLQTIHYRPFDLRVIYFDKDLIDRPRTKVMQHLVERNNIGLSFGRAGAVVGGKEWNLVFCSKKIVDLNLFYRGGNNFAPLFLYLEKNKIPNFSKSFISQLENILQISFSDPNLQDWILHENERLPENSKIQIGKLKSNKSFTAEDIFDYIYAQLHAPKYRQHFAEELKSDFPRVVLPKNSTQFFQMTELGKELRLFHTLEHPNLSTPSNWNFGTQEIKGETIEAVEYDETTKEIKVNDQTAFTNISKEIWNFQIGGYQVLKKYLKERTGTKKKKGMSLEKFDTLHFLKICAVLSETLRLQKEIDIIFKF